MRRRASVFGVLGRALRLAGTLAVFLLLVVFSVAVRRLAAAGSAVCRGWSADDRRQEGMEGA